MHWNSTSPQAQASSLCGNPPINEDLSFSCLLLHLPMKDYSFLLRDFTHILLDLLLGPFWDWDLILHYLPVNTLGCFCSVMLAGDTRLPRRWKWYHSRIASSLHVGFPRSGQWMLFTEWVYFSAEEQSWGTNCSMARNKHTWSLSKRKVSHLRLHCKKCNPKMWPMGRILRVSNSWYIHWTTDSVFPTVL